MKKYMNRLMGISLLSLLLIVGGVHQASAQDVSVSYQSFYDNLSPYGQWVNDPQYGNVWVPNEGGDFRPYGSRGHWVMTDYGNTWVSDDPWGWACYHYGRWTYNPYYGWVWIPGYEWAPAWVSWRFGGDQCGWAPLGPGVSVGVAYNCPDSWWVFVGAQYMYRPDCFHYWRGPEYNGGYIHQTTFVNNYYRDNGTHVRYNYGPRAEAIQQVTHQPVQVYRVSQTNRPGAPSVGRNTVSLYRPAVNRATASTARPANVMTAPKPIGRPQAAGSVSASHQPAFRQQVQNHAAAPAQGGQRPGQASAPQPQHGNPQPQRANPQPQIRPQTEQQPQRGTQQQQNRPQPQQGQPQRPQPQQGQPQRQVQQNRPQPQQALPQRPQPEQQQRPQPQMQQRPEPQQQRPQPQMQQPRPQPQMQHQQAPPRMEAPREQPREEGGRR